MNEFTDQYFDSTASSSWTASPLNTMSTYVCKGRSLFGGFNNFISSQKIWKYYDLPSHNEIRIIFDLYGFGDWGSTNLRIYFDDDLKGDINFNDNSYINNFCGEMNVQGFNKSVVINGLHVNMNFKLKIESYELNTGVWWGIRNLMIFIKNKCPALCLRCDDQNICNDFVQFAFQKEDKSVTCRDGFFPDVSINQCRLCHISCKTCFSETASDCLSCFDTDSLNENKCEKSKSKKKIE